MAFLHLDNVQNKTRRPSYWNFNNSLCDDVDYCRELNELVPAWINLYKDVEDERILWELLKFEVRKFSQTFVKKKAVNKLQYLKSLEDKDKDIEIKVSNNSSEENKKAMKICR